jgi:uroporphyrin-III C-methyltransferase / precorrin-2 dehydrogenase / sirohydrochlorin ferrochelatase
MKRVEPGLVSLVGAGPGHPDYLTLKGLRCLREADVVFHDALVTSEVLALAGNAECIDVGKRGGRESTEQEAIEAALIAASRRGLRVVRLKGGDAFVFGRGSEEAMALSVAGVPFEIVPGVSASIAAPALSGIPVTHRGLSSAFLVVNGADPDAFEELVSGVAPGSVTVVVMMALGARAAIAGALINLGWQVRTPAAIVAGASMAGAWTWRGTLAELGVSTQPASADLPGTLVIGPVAALPLSLANGVPSAVEMRVAHVRA